MPKLKTKVFSSQSESLIKQPFLAEVQISSWKWFFRERIKRAFDEISPIKDPSGKDLELYFTDYYFDKPKHDEEHRGLKI